MKKILTIIVPTYNMELYLDRALRSLIIADKDLMKSLDVLIINDGSKDASSVIAHKYVELYPDVYRVIEKENGHYGSCINRGLKEAKGKYIKILDADDWYDTINFESFLHFLKGTDVDLVVSYFDMVTQTGDVVIKGRYKSTQKPIKLNENTELYEMWMHAVTYKLTIFDNLPYHQTEGISYTDQEWIFLPMVRVKSVHVFPYVVYKYLVERDGQSVSPSVFVKNMPQEIQSFKAQQSAWELSGKIGRGDASEYMNYRLLWRSKMIYQHIILRFYQGFRNKDLIELDNDIKSNNPELYNWLDAYKFDDRHFRFIHYWRKWFHCRPLIWLFVKLDNFGPHIRDKYLNSARQS